MKYDYTVESPKTDNRRYKREQIKRKLRLKRKFGYKRSDAVCDRQLAK